MRVGPRVFGESGELTRDLDVLRDAVGPQSPVALLGVLLAQRVGIERKALTACRHRIRIFARALSARGA